MHTIKQIADNQSQFKQEIFDFLKNDTQLSLDILRSISTEDSKINDELMGLKKKINDMKIPSISSLFLFNKNHNKKYYAWWDVETEEAIIYKYVET